MSINPITGLEELVCESPMGIDAGPHLDLGIRKVVMSEGNGKEFPFTSLTSKQAMWEIHCIRGSDDDATQFARTSWDGVPDKAWNFRVRNYALNAADTGAQLVGMLQCQNRSGGRIYWMRGLDIEMDNRGICTESQKGLRISMRNNTGANLSTGSAGLEIELLGQAAPSGYERAIDLIHNDGSHVTKPTAIVVRAPSSSDGFAFALDIQANGLKKDGAALATSALLKAVDDGENADLASAVATVNGALKVVIGSTVCYIPTYAGYTPA